MSKRRCEEKEEKAIPRLQKKHFEKKEEAIQTDNLSVERTEEQTEKNKVQQEMIDPEIAIHTENLEESGERYKAKKTIAQKLMIIFLAAVLCFLLYDAIEAFADAILPEGEITIRITDHNDGISQNVVLCREYISKEIFNLFQKEYKKQSNSEVNWVYTQGITGESWTTLASSTPNTVLTIMARKDPDSFFTVWESAFDMTVENGKTETISNQGEASLLRIYPFKDSHTRQNITIILNILSFIIFCLILNTAIEGKNRSPYVKKRTQKNATAE
ncbi:MAG: hypothetical protein IJK06_08315 [Clostridia bacterium]|nr:hypothetical protein [Clostridia bacterium]